MKSRKMAGGEGVPHKYLCMAGMSGVKLRSPKKVEVDSEAKLAATPAEDQEIPDVQTLIVQNPTMNASSFFNLLVSKGFRVVKETQPTMPALARAQESIKESGTACRMLESAEGQGGVDANGNARYQNRFRAILIQEGLGNLKDGFYYTKEALKSAVPVFEGRKFYADHPSSFEEEVRPERSVRDVYGHFENIEYKEAADGTGQLHGDIVVLTDESADWVRARLVHAIDYAKKYPDKDFLGLSINASGDAKPIGIEEFLQSGDLAKSAVAKVQEAMAGGLTEVKVVKTIDQATSCDLVTEAGAKGKVLQMLEANRMEKKHEAEEKKKEAEEAQKEGEEAAPAAHDDEQADKELILQMLKKHGLIGDAEEAAPADGEPPVDAEKKEEPAAEEEQAEAKEAEEGEEAKMMKAAMHYHQAYKAAGYEAAEAADRAVEAMKCAKHAHEAMEAAEAAHKEAKEDECKEAEEKKEAHKESGEVIKLKGENAALKERLAKLEVEKYLDKKMQESRLPMSVTKRFRESIKSGFKSTKEVDEKFKSFMEGYQAFGGEAASLDEFVMTEKNTSAAGGGISLDDCVED